MELLNVEPMKSDPANATVPIVEFLYYQIGILLSCHSVMGPTKDLFKCRGMS